jgi:RNA polymerase sigma-70 factor, ECF subfamily
LREDNQLSQLTVFSAKIPVLRAYNCRNLRGPLAQPVDITALLHRWRDGNVEAENELFRAVLPDLRKLAQYLMRGERKGQSLQATELVDQIYFRLAGTRDRDWQDRHHFFAIAARAMRRYLIDRARARPDAEFVVLDGIESRLRAAPGRVEVALVVDRLLDQLSELNPEWSRLVELKFFLGLTDEETAEVLGLKVRTMQRMWLQARAWLFSQMVNSNASNAAGR